MTEWEKAQNGYLYDANYDKEIVDARTRCADLCYEFNQCRPSDTEKQKELLGQILGSMKENPVITAPFYCDYGFNISIGENFYTNHNVMILDGAKVTFGDNVFIAPNCVFSTAGHAIDSEQRGKGLEIARPIMVGDNVWIGTNVSVLPGVTIGSNTIIGAGSVVNKNIPEGVIAAGNPCKVIREITEADKRKYPVFDESCRTLKAKFQFIELINEDLEGFNKESMKNLRLREASVRELDQIRELYWRLLDSSPKYSQILQWKKNIYPNDDDWTVYIANGEMYLILQDADVIGAVAVTNAQPEEYRKIHWTVKIEDQEAAGVHLLMIAPEYQGQGAATAAIDEIIKMAAAKKKKAVRLDAIGTNVPAQKLYEKYGFVNCGTAQEYYESTGETEFIFYEYVLMEK